MPTRRAISATEGPVILSLQARFVGISPQAFVLESSGRLRAELYAPSLRAMLRVTQALLRNGSVSGLS